MKISPMCSLIIFYFNYQNSILLFYYENYTVFIVEKTKNATANNDKFKKLTNNN